MQIALYRNRSSDFGLSFFTSAFAFLGRRTAWNAAMQHGIEKKGHIRTSTASENCMREPNMLQKLRQRHSKLCNDWLCSIYSIIIHVTCILYIKYITDMVLHDIKHRHQSVSIIVFQLHWVIQFGSGLLGILPASSLTALKPEAHVMLKWWGDLPNVAAWGVRILLN